MRPFSRLFNGVAYPPYGFDELGLAGRLPQLLPQPGDVGHDGVVLCLLPVEPVT